MSANKEERTKRIIGPSLAPDITCPASGIGPAIPEHLLRAHLAAKADEEDDGLVIDPTEIGPLCPGYEIYDELRHVTQESTGGASDAKKLKQKGLQREAWMTEFLPVTQQIALKPRKFRQNPCERGVDASWFEDPSGDSNSKAATCASNKASHITLPSSVVEAAINFRDKKMSQLTETYNKIHKRQDSMLDKHQRKLAKKAKKERRKKEKDSKRHKKHKHDRKSENSSSSKEPERRPFDRDRDLATTRIDPTARRAIIERSKQLSTKFSYGNQKFL